MLKPVMKMNEENGQKQLYIVPESDLEERFVLWFAYENSIPRHRVNSRESLAFHYSSNPDLVQQSIINAYNDFKQKFNYVEIPCLIGVSLARAREELNMRGLQWAIEREIETDKYPPGHVAGQNPLSEAMVSAHGVVYLTISK